MNLRNSRYFEARPPKMPVGLVELMEQLSKDVLRNNPTDIYSFCANHMKKLLLIRDGTKSRKVQNVDEKIALAIVKVRERADLRRKNYDTRIEAMTNGIKCLNEFPQDSDINAEQYVQKRVIKILENDLKDNKEHELIAAIGSKENPKSETVGNNPTFIETTKEILDNNESVSSTSAQHKDNSNNVTEELIINESVNSDKQQNTAVLVSEPLIKIAEFIKNDNNNELFELEKHIGDDESYDAEGEHTNEQNDKDKNNDDEFKQIDNSEIEINIINGSEIKEFKSLNYNNDDKNENFIDDYKNDFLPTPITFENDNPNEDHLKETKSTEEKKRAEAFNNKESKDNNSKSEYSESRNHAIHQSMDLETAAITIQKVFRSFLFRNKTQSIDDATNIDVNLLVEEKEDKNGDKEESNMNKLKDRRTLGINRMDTMLQTVNEEKSLSLSTDDSSTISSAATIIQAHVRGFLVRNKFNSNKTASSTSGIDSDAQSFTSLEGDNDNRKNKTILNIHIVPETGHFMSREESVLTSIDMSLDGSPPSSTNLHPLGYDKSERRKLKREDAIQSISPPSNNSGKLSEDIDSIKEILINNDNNDQQVVKTQVSEDITDKNSFTTNVLNDENISTVIDNVKSGEEQHTEFDDPVNLKRLSTLVEMNSDEMDVVTPTTSIEGTPAPESDMKLLHSGECHDMVLPTKVSRNDASIVRGE